MATVKGVWVLHDTLTFHVTTGVESLSATSNGEQIVGIQVASSSLNYYRTADSITAYGRGNWAKEAYKTVDFGETEQEVSDNFYTWLTTNATTKDIEYSIKGSTMTAIANQVRRISGVEGELTPEQMETNLLNVTPLGEYPKAEESAFGLNKDTQNGILSHGSASPVSTNYSAGWTFVTNEAFSIVGVRNKANNEVRLADESGNVIKTIPASELKQDGEWYTAYFDTPMAVPVGVSFKISSRGGYESELSGIAWNGLLTFSRSEWGYYPSMPSIANTSTVGLVDIIIAPVQAELPDDYQIQRTTMDDIAEEVQRISGAITKLSTAQIIAGLSEVEVLEDYEEVAF